MIRVLVAEDSMAARVLLVSLLEEDPEIEVVGDVGDGAAALALAKQLRPDVITMDIHMPVMDGLEATERIMHEVPTPIVVVSSAVDPRDVATSFRVTQAGALAAISKPGSAVGPAADVERRQFVSTVKAMAAVKVVRRWRTGETGTPPWGALPESQDASSLSISAHRPAEPSGGSSKPDTGPPGRRIVLVAIAASTGGPTALQIVLGGLPASFPAPILVVQHISDGFLRGFADWLASECSLKVKIAEPDEPLSAGTVYLAPKGAHLAVSPDRRARSLTGMPVNGYLPSASTMFDSAAEVYGPEMAAVILTGMGSDGVSGLRKVKARGGFVIAQDEATSLIYGMPGEAVRAGVVDLSLPIRSVSGQLLGLVRR
jgi:two-component system chemotaxis response regulator CheB